MEHVHHGKSSEKFLNTDEILNELNLKDDDTFMDAGCGDGHIAIRAIEKYLPDGSVYAVDVYDVAIGELNDYVKENNLENLIAVEANIAKGIPEIDEGSIDVILLVNVIHGFKGSGEMNDVISELKRLTKDNGRIAIVEFKPIEMSFGPPMDIRFAWNELRELFQDNGFKMSHLNVELGEDVAEGKSHYLIIFEKE